MDDLSGERNSNVDHRSEIGVRFAPLLKDETITPEKATNIAGVGMFQVKLVILSGFTWMASGFEMVTISSVTPVLACTWNLENWHGALLSTVTILSTALGSILYGIVSDKYGRRTALSSSLIFFFVFGAVSAGLPSYTWFITFRALASFSTGGLVQSLVLCCEFFPKGKRGQAICVLPCFWALGVLIMLWVFYSVMDKLDGWKLFVAIGTLPALLAMVLMRFFPESFRFLMVSDQYFGADETVIQMIKANSKKISGRLSHLSSRGHRWFVLDFFRTPFLRSSILFWWMGFVTSISLLGLETLTPDLLQNGEEDVEQPKNVSALNFISDIHQPILCLKFMPTEEFILVMWTTALEFPAFVIYMMLVDWIDRRRLLGACYILSCVFIFLLLVPHVQLTLHIVFVYVARTLLCGQFVLLLLMVAETFPTSHRGTAVGFEMATFQIGQFLSSYISQALLWRRTMYCYILYSGLTLLCSFACFGLKNETRGKELQDIIGKYSVDSKDTRDSETSLRAAKFY